MRRPRNENILLFMLFFLSTFYVQHWSLKVFEYVQALMPSSRTARMNFLNNTFCGKLVSGTWEDTLPEKRIKQRHRFLQGRNIHFEIAYTSLSCSEFIAMNGFYSKDITTIERENPMAFTILSYKHFYQFQVLMRTLYVRTNFHCIHVDRDAPGYFFGYAVKLSTCLENVVIVNRRRKVGWGEFNILEVERLCQSILLNQSSTWYYYMTIAGTELPIQTNLNRVQILQLVPDKSRTDVSSYPQPYPRQTSKKELPPDNMTIYKGELHTLLTRDFITAAHTNPTAFKLYVYLNGTDIPDEHYYSSLVRLPDFPGGKARAVSNYYHEELLSHYKIWVNLDIGMCQSNIDRNGVCQFNYKDLANIENSGRLFANKFNEDYDLVSIDCWEQWFKLKEKYPQDINPQKYIDQYPLLQTATQLQ